MLKNESSLVESQLFKGFYHCPLFETLVISRDGRIIDQRNLVCFIPFMGMAWPYLLVNVWGFGTHTVHRLIAMTFNECPGHFDDFVINHKDGDKLNNYPENLEWVTHSDNAFHAYREGLRSDNRALLSKDLLTDEVKYFYSLQEAARYFKVNGSEIYRYLNSDSFVPWKTRFELIYENSSWRGLTKADIGKKANGQAKAVVVIRDDMKFIFESISDTGRFFGLTNSKMFAILAGKSSVHGLSVCYLDEFDGSLDDGVLMPSHKRSVIRPNFKRTPKPVDVTDNSTGLTTRWDSVQAFAESVGVTKSAVQKSMNSNMGNWRHYKLNYL